LSKILSVAVSGGVKVTDTLQLFPGLSVPLHCDFIANGRGADRPKAVIREALVSVVLRTVKIVLVFIPNTAVCC